MSITAAIICAVVYAVINWLDPYTLSWQCLNRPIVVAPLVGLLLGDFQTGIIMGASLEAIFMGISAVGGSIPSDCLSGSIIAVAYAIVVGGDGAMETGLALSLTIGTVMTTINTMLMPLWAGLAPSLGEDWLLSASQPSSVPFPWSSTSSPACPVRQSSSWALPLASRVCRLVWLPAPHGS